MPCNELNKHFIDNFVISHTEIVVEFLLDLKNNSIREYAKLSFDGIILHIEVVFIHRSLR